MILRHLAARQWRFAHDPNSALNGAGKPDSILTRKTDSIFLPIITGCYSENDPRQENCDLLRLRNQPEGRYDFEGAILTNAGGMKELKDLAVLVVDDDSAIFAVIARMFSHFKATVDYSASAIEALERLMTREYKTMITNVELAGMGGLELTRRARELDSALNIVLFTGNTTEQVLKLALDPKVLDLSEVNMKPCSLGEMLKGIINKETGRTFLLE